jgi:hypothetical protein
MSRPKDIHGNEVEMGPWYWGRSRTGLIIGTGKFAVQIVASGVMWIINGTGYSPEGLQFVRAEEPDFGDG